MKKQTITTKAKITALVSAAFISFGAVSAQAGYGSEKVEMEKCYGIAKAGKNDCKTAKHSCAGKSTMDNASDEFVLMKVGTCVDAGGSVVSQ